MATPKKKKSVLKGKKEQEVAGSDNPFNIKSGDIRTMANDSFFRQYLKVRKIDIDKIPTGAEMHKLYMKYLDATGQG
tara:strand:+ start:149 stop:379 length:231 start_codon:yes stop_codon:yes gene_type:complete